jgi:hypothetical protein
LYNYRSEKRLVTEFTETGLLDQFVIVMYDDLPYPGKVIDFDEQDVRVDCMNRVGKNLAKVFFWPRLRKDICWYPYSKVLGMISELEKINDRHFAIDQEVYDQVCETIK